jgi:hypothetical protein
LGDRKNEVANQPKGGISHLPISGPSVEASTVNQH